MTELVFKMKPPNLIELTSFAASRDLKMGFFIFLQLLLLTGGGIYRQQITHQTKQKLCLKKKSHTFQSLTTLIWNTPDPTLRIRSIVKDFDQMLTKSDRIKWSRNLKQFWPTEQIAPGTSTTSAKRLMKLHYQED